MTILSGDFFINEMLIKLVVKDEKTKTINKIELSLGDQYEDWANERNLINVKVVINDCEDYEPFFTWLDQENFDNLFVNDVPDILLNFTN